MSDTRRYLLNILWSWLGSAALILSGLLLSPYVIRKLGAAEFGIWALATSFVEYLWLIDLGFRPAVVKLSSEYRALGQEAHIDSVVSTAVGYCSFAGLLLLVGVWVGAPYLMGVFRIHHPAFPLLVRMVGISWSFGIVFNVFAAVTEGYQRFDLTNHITIASTLVRALGTFAVLGAGYGLVEMGYVLLAAQFLAYGLMYVAWRKVRPGARIALDQMRWETGREMWAYGRQVFTAMMAARLSQSSIPSLIAFFLPVENVAYYSVTQRALDYTGNLIGRVGLVTAPRAMDWMARGQVGSVIRLAEQGNRYCLALFGFFGTFLLIYGHPLFRLWIGQETASATVILLPVLSVGYTLLQGQFVSLAVLMGIGRYGRYAISLMVEAVVMIGALAIVLPRWGLAGGGVVIAVLMILNRSVNAAVIFSASFQIAARPYLTSIYARPLLVMAIQIALLVLLRNGGIAGESWWEMIAAGAIASAVYGLLALVLVVKPEHRQKLTAKIEFYGRRLGLSW